MMKLTVWNVLDIVEALPRRLRKQPDDLARLSSLERVRKEANAQYENIVGRFDINDRLPSRKLVGVETEADMLEISRKGGKFDEESNQWYVPDNIPEASLVAFEKWWPIVPDDLRDREAQMIRTTTGRSIESYILPRDETSGDDSLATPLLYAALPFLSAVSYFGFSIHPIFALLGLVLTFPFVAAISHGEGGGEAAKSFLLFYLLPIIGAILIPMASGSGGMGGMLGGLPLVGPVFAMLGGAGGGELFSVQAIIVKMMLAIVMFFPILFFIVAFRIMFKSDGDTSFRNSMQVAAALAITLFAISVLPPWIGVYAIFALACVAPISYSEREWVDRFTELGAQGARFGLSASDKTASITEGVKRQQAANAIADTTPTIVIGIASGNLSSQKYAFAPDRGSPMRLSMKDMSMHLLGFGETGRGKTANYARSIALQYRAARYGGALIRDGKGTLAGELRQIIDMMIEPGLPLALIEGLTAKQVAFTLNSFGSKDVKDPTWQIGADQIIDHATTIHEALHKHEFVFKDLAIRQARSLENQLTYLGMEIAKRVARNQDVSDARKAFAEIKLRKDNWVAVRDRERRWLWNIETLLRVIEAMTDCRTVNGVPSVGPKMADIGAELGYNAQLARLQESPESIYSELNTHSQLDGSLSYVFGAAWTGLANETRTSFISNVNQRIMPLVRGKDLKDKNGTPWYILEKGADVEQALYGKFVGINLPVIEHGMAADVVQALVCQRIYTGVKKRAPFSNKWAKHFVGQRPLMDICDECQLVVGKEELDMAPIARSLGLKMVMFTQGYESLAARFQSDHKTVQFANTFQSLLVLKSSVETYNYVIKRFGDVRKLKRGDKHTTGLDYKHGTQEWHRDPINDLNHPGRTLFRLLKRKGVGEISAVKSDEFGDLSFGKRFKVKDHELLTLKRVVGGLHFEDQPLFNQVAYTQELNQQGTAIVYLQRASAPRADTATMNYVSDDTLDFVGEHGDVALNVIKLATERGVLIEQAVKEFKRQNAIK